MLQPVPSAVSDQEDEDHEFGLMGRLRIAQRLTECAEARKPELTDAALHGLPGEIVRTVLPLTEAPAANILVSLLCTAGAMIGRGCWVMVGESHHYSNIFAILIGPTAKGRKGTGLSATKPLFEAFPEGREFLDKHAPTGALQSGEALIAAVAPPSVAAFSRDPFLGAVSSCFAGCALVVEEEFHRLLVVSERSGSTVSEILRKAWDSGTLQLLTRKESLRADNAHVSILGHITPEELRTGQSQRSITNGFANRFLYIYTERSKKLPNPGRLTENDKDRLGKKLRAAIKFAQTAGEITRSESFNDQWHRVYCTLESQPSGGVAYDALRSRAAPNILRLALLFAVLGHSRVLEPEHLDAALAVWTYCEQTVGLVYGIAGSSELRV